MRTLVTLVFSLAFAASTFGGEPATAPAAAGTPAGTAQGTGSASGYDTTVYQLKHARAHAVLPNISRQLAQKVPGVQVVLLPTTADDALVAICPRQQTSLVKQAIEACDVKRQYAVKVQLFEIADDGRTIPVSGPSLIVGRDGTLQCSTSPDELVTLSLKVGQPAPSVGGCILPNPPEPVATLGAAAADPSCADAGDCCTATACGVGPGICPVCGVCGGSECPLCQQARCQNELQCGKDGECHAQVESKCKCSETGDQCNDADESVAEQAEEKNSVNSSADKFSKLIAAYNKAAREDRWSDAVRIAEQAKQLNCNQTIAAIMHTNARFGAMIARNKSIRTSGCPGCEVGECGKIERCSGTADSCADGKCKSESAKACGNCCEEACETNHETAKGEVAEGPAADECPIAAECECSKSSKKSLVKREMQDLIEEYNRLVKQDRFAEAEMIARQAKELDPHDPIANLMFEKARLGRSIAFRNEKFRFRFEALLNEFCPASYEVRCGDGGPAANEVSKADVSKAPGIDDSIAAEESGTAKPSQDTDCQCPAASPSGQSTATSQSTASSGMFGGTICGTISGLPSDGTGAIRQVPTLTHSWSFNPWFTAPGQNAGSQNGAVLSPARFGFTIRLFGDKPEVCGSIRVSDGQGAGTCHSGCEANGQPECDKQCPNACTGAHCEPPALLSLQNLNLDTLLLPFWQNELLEWYRTCRLSEVFNAHNPPDSSSKLVGRLVAEFPKLAAQDNHEHAHGLIIVEMPDRIRVFEGAPPAAEIAKSPAGLCHDCREEFSKFLEEIFRVPSMAQEISQVGHSEVEPSTGDAPRDLPSVEHSKIETTVVTYPLHDLVLLDDAGRPVFDTCTIIDHIQSAVAPETWFHPSVSIQLDQQSVSLVIRQTPEVHAKIEDHLRYLRRLQVKQLCNLIERISVNTGVTTGPTAQHKPAAAEPKVAPEEGAYDVLQGINPN